MNQINKLVYILVFLVVVSASNAQKITDFKFKAKIEGETTSWAKLRIPSEVFNCTNQNLSDIRVLGITENKDTIQAPFIIRKNSDRTISNKLKIKVLNKSKINTVYYYSFELLSEQTLSLIDLKFKNKNFDWKINLEASQDQNTWFQVLDKYRILSIYNRKVDYSFTSIDIPESKYRYYRIAIPSNEEPQLLDLSVYEKKTIAADFVDVLNSKIKSIQNKELKQTKLFVDFENTIRMNKLCFNTNDKVDFYRPVSVRSITDSIEMNGNWVYKYDLIYSGVLTSEKSACLSFASKSAKKLEIIIWNDDNHELDFSSVKARSYTYDMLIRFDKTASYFLCYGGDEIAFANYDLLNFSEKIPDVYNELKLSNNIRLSQDKNEALLPFLESKIILWLIMLSLIIILAWYSIRLLKSNK
ncbi:MAG: hypothetical protein N4A49_04175 [Marinifilaceae bacterium]|jgi:hypothetical protein|nr:hypothetical protein [Marinifilaceae bacterium]